MATTGSISRNPQAKYLVEAVEVDAADVDTDGSGDFTITFSNLRGIIAESRVHASLENGMQAVVMSILGNAATMRIFTYTGGSPAAHTTQSNVSICHARAEGF